MTVFLQAVRYFTNIFFKFTTQKVQINNKQGNFDYFIRQTPAIQKVNTPKTASFPKVFLHR